jgi:TP901 family phage tail tape measure protein
MTTANTDLVQLGDAMKYVGPVAKQAGYSLEETVAAVQLLSNAGIQADMAGTTLRGAILSVTDPSAEARELLAELGVSILDAQGDMRPLADIIDDMNRALEGLGSGQKLGIIGRVFDARQAAGFAELMSQGGDRLRQAIKALEDSEGTAARIAGTQLDTLYGAFLLFTSALEGVAITIGEVLAPILRDWGARMTVAANALRRLIDNNREFVATLAKRARICSRRPSEKHPSSFTTHSRRRGRSAAQELSNHLNHLKMHMGTHPLHLSGNARNKTAVCARPNPTCQRPTLTPHLPSCAHCLATPES